MLQEVVNNLSSIGLVISLFYTLYKWHKLYKKNISKHPDFKDLFWIFSTFYLVYTGVTSSILSIYLILSPILGFQFFTIKIDDVKYTMIIGELALLYLGLTKLKEKDL